MYYQAVKVRIRLLSPNWSKTHLQPRHKKKRLFSPLTFHISFFLCRYNITKTRGFAANSKWVLEMWRKDPLSVDDSWHKSTIHQEEFEREVSDVRFLPLIQNTTFQSPQARESPSKTESENLCWTFHTGSRWLYLRKTASESWLWSFFLHQEGWIVGWEKSESVQNLFQEELDSWYNLLFSSHVNGSIWWN